MARNTSQPQEFTPAETLEEALKMLSPQPLRTPEQIRCLYEDDLNNDNVRGKDRIKKLCRELSLSAGGAFFKRFLIGHSGVGKTTELHRLMDDDEIKKHFRTVLLSAEEDLNPQGADALDVMQCIVSAVIQEMEKAFPHWTPDKSLVEVMRDYFREEETISEKYRKSELELDTGVQAGGGWPGILKLTARLRAGIRAGVGTTVTRREIRARRLAEFSEPAGLLLEACSEQLQKEEGREWLLLFDDFEKSCVSWECLHDTFIRHGQALAQLNVRIVVVAPLALICSKAGAALPFPWDFIPDTPVFKQDHRTPHEDGRHAMKEVIACRMSKKLFAPDQIDRVIVNSGGNLRDCFEVLYNASLDALERKSALIEEQNITNAVNQLRIKYEYRLGDNPLDDEKPVPYKEKAARLVAIYKQDPDACVTDTIMHNLIAAGVVQEFNTTHWFGVHPMVVEILRRQEKLPGDIET